MISIILASFEQGNLEPPSFPFVSVQVKPESVIEFVLDLRDQPVRMFAEASRPTVLYLEGVACCLRASHFLRFDFKFGQGQHRRGFFRVDHEFNRFVVQVRPNLVTFLSHDRLDIHSVIIEPAQVVRDQVMFLTSLAPDEHDTFCVRIA